MRRMFASGDPDFAWRMPEDEWDAIALNYTSGTNGQPEGRRLSPSGRSADALRQQPRSRHGSALGLPVDAAHVPLQRVVLPLVESMTLADLVPPHPIAVTPDDLQGALIAS